MNTTKKPTWYETVLKYIFSKEAPLYILVGLGVKGVWVLIEIKAGFLNQGQRITDLEHWRWQTEVKIDSFNVFQNNKNREDSEQDAKHFELVGVVKNLQDKVENEEKKDIKKLK